MALVAKDPKKKMVGAAGNLGAAAPTPAITIDSPGVLGFGTSLATGVVVGGPTVPVYIDGVKYGPAVYGEFYSTSTAAIGAAANTVGAFGGAMTFQQGTTPSPFPAGGFSGSGVSLATNGQTIVFATPGLYELSWRLSTASSTQFLGMGVVAVSGNINGIVVTSPVLLAYTVVSGSDEIIGNCLIDPLVALSSIEIVNTCTTAITPSVTAAGGMNNSVNNVTIRQIFAQ